MDEFKREQRTLLKEIDRQSCISRINDVMKHSGYRYNLMEFKEKVELHVFADEWNELWFSFQYEGAAGVNQTEHLLEDIKTIMEINGRYFQSPFIIKHFFHVHDPED